MSDFAAYMLAQSERRRAYAEYDAAAARLQLAQIRERLAEMKSQVKPVDLLEKLPAGREQIHAAAFYAVVGRMP